MVWHFFLIWQRLFHYRKHMCENWTKVEDFYKEPTNRAFIFIRADIPDFTLLNYKGPPELNNINNVAIRIIAICAFSSTNWLKRWILRYFYANVRKIQMPWSDWTDSVIVDLLLVCLEIIRNAAFTFDLLCTVIPICGFDYVTSCFNSMERSGN